MHDKKHIRVIVFDVDGTLTDGKIYMGKEGEVCKTFHVQDGYGISTILPLHHILPVIITGRSSDILVKRCNELNVSLFFQDCKDKVKRLEAVANELGFIPDQHGVYQEIAYMGDDCIDIAPMKRCLVTGCPSDAVVQVKNMVTKVCFKKGGEGAAREFIEWIIEKRD